MHVYDALCRSKCHAAQMGCMAQVSGIARLVGVQKWHKTMLTWRVSLNTWLLRISSTCFLLLNYFLFFYHSIGFYGGWPLCFFSSESPAVGCVQHSFMDLAPQICTLRRSSSTVLPILQCQETLSWRRRVMHISDILPRRDLKLTFLSVTDMYIRTYAHTLRV